MEHAAPLEFSVSTYEGCLGNFSGEMVNFEIDEVRWRSSTKGEFCIKRISMKTVIPNLSQARPAKHPAVVLRAVRA